MGKAHRGRKRRTSQAYYWTDEWQAGEAAAVEEIRAGKARVFDNADDAIDWLLSEDTKRPRPLGQRDGAEDAP